MMIHLRYEHATPSHCDVVIFVNGAQAGRLVLRREEIDGFQRVISQGCVPGLDRFRASGDLNPPEGARGETPPR